MDRMTYEIEYATFRKVRVEAESQEQAEEKAAVMEDEDIERGSSFEGYVVWDKPKLIKGGQV